jgi:hypothetical protein
MDPSIPTAAQITEEQYSSKAVAVPKAAVPAVPDKRTAAQSYVEEHAGQAGRGVKFDHKKSAFVTADDGTELSEEDDFVALVDQTLEEMIRFNGKGSPPTRVSGLIYEGFRRPPREELGDLDESRWDIGLNGQPADPWQHRVHVVLQHAETQELFVFVTGSLSGHRAVGNLMKHYNRTLRTHPDDYPVVRLKVGGFQHRDERIGWVPTPVFAVVGRKPRGDSARPDTSLAADLNDEIPL